MFMIERQKWINHNFNLGIAVGWSKNIMSRLGNTEILLKHYVKNLTNGQLGQRTNDHWSIKEHIGHLTDLECLWLNRFEQFEQGLTELVAADMANQKTEKSNHNVLDIEVLLENFTINRQILLDKVKLFSEKTQNHMAFHPRIKTMMKPVDLLFFIAEHDNHHITSIIEIIEKLPIQKPLKKYIIIEHFDAKKIKILYQRFDEKGRMLPKGLQYIDSWIDQEVQTCYQLMESESIEILEEWVNNWKDLADFEIVPVISSQEAKTKVFSKQ
jgi:uncharacterized damage-inducible protein DinB